MIFGSVFNEGVYIEKRKKKKIILLELARCDHLMVRATTNQEHTYHHLDDMTRDHGEQSVQHPVWKYFS